MSPENLQPHSLLLITMNTDAIIKRPVPELREPRSSGFLPFMITHFNTIVSTFRDWFRRIWIKLRGMVVGFPLSQISEDTQTLQKKKWVHTLLSSLEVSCAPKAWKLPRYVRTDADTAVEFGDTIKGTHCMKRIILRSRRMNKAY